MKIKELENYLSQCEPFPKPKVELEQYQTSAHIAARMLYAAQEHIQGSKVCDLGSGCGVLSLGSVMCGAKYVCGLEIDREAIDIAIKNRDDILEGEGAATLEFIQASVQSYGERSGMEEFFDVVQKNSDHGEESKDLFDLVSMKLTRPGGYIFSLHKTSTRAFFLKKLKGLGMEGRVLAQVHFDLPRTHNFHKVKSKDVEVDFWEFKKSSLK